MKLNKKTIIGCLSIIILLIGKAVVLSKSSGPTSSHSENFPNLSLLEDKLHIRVHNFYDVEEYVFNEKEIQIKDASKKFVISGEKSEYLYYSIETTNLSSAYYFSNDRFDFIPQDNAEKISMGGNYTLYRTSYEDDNGIDTIYLSMVQTDDFNYTIRLVVSDLEKEVVEKRLINYIKLVENIN